jgi:hypothetical protein
MSRVSPINVISPINFFFLEQSRNRGTDETIFFFRGAKHWKKKMNRRNGKAGDFEQEDMLGDAIGLKFHTTRHGMLPHFVDTLVNHTPLLSQRA